MTQLLRIDSSARLTGSQSRLLGDYFERRWQRDNPLGRSIHRDLSDQAIEQIEQDTITGFYTPHEQMTSGLKAATALSDELIKELQSSETLLITVPIYNFSIPAALKAWIDQVVRIGQTFSYDGESFGGLVKTREAYIITAYGASGYLKGGGFEAANFVEPYLKFLFTFLGINELHFISIEGTTGETEMVDAAIRGSKREIDDLFSSIQLAEELSA